MWLCPFQGAVLCGRASEARAAGDAQMRSKRAKKQGDERVFDMALEDVFTFGTHLGHHDVTEN